ncbi:MAG TPA: hypothetical protein VGS19_24080 [Streptosporangiaceae bacterium]|nr:hypothetical protein [Streptosporangiaceae bacterium]
MKRRGNLVRKLREVASVMNALDRNSPLTVLSGHYDQRATGEFKPQLTRNTCQRLVAEVEQIKMVDKVSVTLGIDIDFECLTQFHNMTRQPSELPSFPVTQASRLLQLKQTASKLPGVITDTLGARSANSSKQ